MFSPYHTSGFYQAPVSKGLLGGLLVSSLGSWFALQRRAHWFLYSSLLQVEFFSILRFLVYRLLFLDPKDLFCAVLILYHFRIFERRYGSLKYSSFLFGIYWLSACIEIGVNLSCHYLKISLDGLPSGPFSLVFGLFVPYFCDIPRVAITHVMGIPVTGKSLAYILGLQMASSSLETALLSACGVVAGVIYRSNILHVQCFLRVPHFLGRILGRTVGRLISSSTPSELQAHMGATLELQRQEQLDQLERQLIWAHTQPQPQNPFGIGLFGNRGANRRPQNQAPPAPPAPPAENQVERLVEMGFNRDSVLNALRSSNNDVNLATNLLLRDTYR